jgi:outer membrane usher protein
VLTNTGALRIQGDDTASADLTRYDTYFTISHPGGLLTTTLGDLTTSAMAWTGPVRLGGVQIRRDFSLRDDVVTSPLLSYSATAAVPSTIDVYIDNVRAYSGAIGQGPFTLTDVAAILRRDHTTVIYHRDTVERDMDRNPGWKAAVDAIAEEITNGQ